MNDTDVGYEARQVQLVWFAGVGSAGSPLNATSVFDALSNGVLPESTSSQRPKINVGGVMQPARFVIEQAGGEGFGCNMSVALNAGRLDVVFQPGVTEGVLKSAPVISDVKALLKNVEGRLSAVCNIVGTCQRVAVVVNYVTEHASAEEAGAAVAAAVGLLKPEENNVSDISLTVNMKTSFEGIEVNRVLKWQVEQFVNIGFPNNGSNPFPTNPVFTSALAIDINTSSPTAMGASKQVSVFLSMFDSIVELRSQNPLLGRKG